MAVSHLPSVPTASSLRILAQLGERTTNCKESWITVTISSLSWKKKMKAKFQTGPLGNVYSSPLYARAPSLLRLFAESPCDCVSKPAVPTATGHGLYLLSCFLRSQTHSYLRKHRSLSFSFLYSAPLTFLSEAWKKKSAVTVAEGRQSLTSGLAIGE